MANGPFSPLFQPGGPFGQIAPGVSPMVNPATMLGFGLHQQQPVQAMAALGQMQQTAQAQQQDQQLLQMRRMQMALEAQERARRIEAQRKAAEGLQAISGGLFSTLAPDLQTDANRRAIEGLGTLPGGPELLTQAWARQAGLSEPGEQFVPVSPAEVRRRGLDEDRAYQMSTKTGKVSQVGSSPLVSIAQPPTGFQATASGGLEPVPGGPADPSRITPAEAARVRDESRLLRKGYDDVQELIELVDKHGPEALGPIRRRMEVLHGSVTMGTGVARGMGALQAHEAEVLGRQIVNPAGLGGYTYGLTPAQRKENIKASLEAIRDEMTEALQRYPKEAGVEVPESRRSPVSGAAAEPIGAERVTPDGIRIRKVGPNAWERVSEE